MTELETSVPVSAPRKGGGAAFSEAPAWTSVGEGWRHLNGSFRKQGYSFEWHDFTPQEEFDWSRSFHPGSVEICLNLTGHAEVRAGRNTLELGPKSACFYLQSGSTLRAVRRAGERHQFVTVELSRDFLQKHLAKSEKGVHPQVAAFLSGRGVSAAVSEPINLSSDHRLLVTSLCKPPVYAASQRLWYHAKSLEIASMLFYSAPETDELFCQRLKRVNQERVQRVIAVLREDMANPPSLEEIGRKVGCSHFYLSRIFTQEMGCSIMNYLRDLRMERAATLLREGKMKVTEVAMEVGYSSPSHFSTAFHAAFGCCPGLYPLKTGTQH